VNGTGEDLVGDFGNVVDTLFICMKESLDVSLVRRMGLPNLSPMLCYELGETIRVIYDWAC
jgi:hypothetical protein